MNCHYSMLLGKENIKHMYKVNINPIQFTQSRWYYVQLPVSTIIYSTIYPSYNLQIVNYIENRLDKIEHQLAILWTTQAEGSTITVQTATSSLAVPGISRGKMSAINMILSKKRDRMEGSITKDSCCCVWGGHIFLLLC